MRPRRPGRCQAHSQVRRHRTDPRCRQRLPTSLGDHSGRLLFATNAGMYHPDYKPVGLYVENGRELVQANTKSGPGNFHMRPNGVLYVPGSLLESRKPARFSSRSLGQTSPPSPDRCWSLMDVYTRASLGTADRESTEVVLAAESRAPWCSPSRRPSLVRRVRASFPRQAGLQERSVPRRRSATSFYSVLYLCAAAVLAGFGLLASAVHG